MGLARRVVWQKIDQYAFAMTVVEVTTGKPPWFERGASRGTFGLQDVEDAVLKGVRPEISAAANPDLIELVKSCWAQEPVDRSALPPSSARALPGAIKTT